MRDHTQGCQMDIARFSDRMCLALRASGLWLRYATLQNLIPSFPWIAPPRPPPWRNPRKGRDQILPSGNPGPGASAAVCVAGGEGGHGGARLVVLRTVPVAHEPAVAGEEEAGREELCRLGL